jgi:hypothetical protein
MHLSPVSVTVLCGVQAFSYKDGRLPITTMTSTLHSPSPVHGNMAAFTITNRSQRRQYPISCRYRLWCETFGPAVSRASALHTDQESP